MKDFEKIKTPFGDNVTIRKQTKPGELMKSTFINYLRASWVFNRWYEKIIVTAAIWWGLYSLIIWLV